MSITDIGTGAAHDVAERRAHRRFPAYLQGHVQDGAARTMTPATVLDLSAGGAQLLLNGDAPSADSVAVQFPQIPGAEPVQASVVRLEDTWQGVVLHVRFEGLNALQTATLEWVLARLESGHREYQEFLAGVGPNPGTA